jgi:hypothetical protein
MLAKQKQRPRQTWQEQYAIMGKWAAVMARADAAAKRH